VRRNSLLAIAGVSAALALIAGLMLRGDNQELARLQQIATSGRETRAELIGRDSRGGYRSTSYFVAARYRIGEHTVTTAFESKALYDTAQQGQIVTVSYATANPSIVELGTRAEVAARRQRGLSTRWRGPAILIALGLCTCVTFAYRLRSRLALVREGTLRWGTVTQVHVFKNNARVTLHVDDGLGSATHFCSASAEFARYQPVGSRAAVLSPPNDPSRVTLCETAMSGLVVDS
jgi:hypothetical protein